VSIKTTVLALKKAVCDRRKSPAEINTKLSYANIRQPGRVNQAMEYRSTVTFVY
jgi:hypothetical protein